MTTSILRLYRNLIHLRQTHPTLVSGQLQNIVAEKNILRFDRVHAGDRIHVVLNMTGEAGETVVEEGSVLISTQLDREGEVVHGPIALRPAEGLVLRIS